MIAALDLRRKENGLSILSREDIENIAEGVLAEYRPASRKDNGVLDTVDFIENHLGLILKRRFIGTPDSGILGMIVMGELAEIPSFDPIGGAQLLEETYGTVIIAPSLGGKRELPRRRFTEAHEAAHFILHGEYFRKLGEGAVIACRIAPDIRLRPRSDAEWMEYQADALAAALLMPRDRFVGTVYEVMKKNGIDRQYLTVGRYANRGRTREIVSEIADRFQVSHQAVRIRLLHLGLISGGEIGGNGENDRRAIAKSGIM